MLVGTLAGGCRCAMPWCNLDLMIVWSCLIPPYLHLYFQVSVFDTILLMLVFSGVCISYDCVDLCNTTLHILVFSGCQF